MLAPAMYTWPLLAFVTPCALASRLPCDTDRHNEGHLDCAADIKAQVAANAVVAETAWFGSPRALRELSGSSSEASASYDESVQEARKFALASSETELDLTSDSLVTQCLHERDASPYYKYGPPYYAPPVPYNYEIQPQRMPPPYFRYGGGGYGETPSCSGGVKERLVSTLESTMGSVEQARMSLEQVLHRMRYRPFGIFQFPRLVLETARTATEMTRELHMVFASAPGACLTQSDSIDNSGGSGDDDSDGPGAEMRERFVNSFENLKKSAQSLESAVVQLLESPFKGFSNIREVFTDLQSSLSSAITAVVGDTNQSDSSGDSSSTDAGGASNTDGGAFAAFTAFSVPGTTTSTQLVISEPASSTGSDEAYSRFADFTWGAAHQATNTAPFEQSGSASAVTTLGPDGDGGGFTRRFTFTAKDMYTFTNIEKIPEGAATITREFDFTTEEDYLFTDTTVLMEARAQVVATGPTALRWPAAGATAAAATPGARAE